MGLGNQTSGDRQSPPALARPARSALGPGQYLLPVAAVFGHHLAQRLQHLDAQPFLVLLQELLGVLDQPEHMREKGGGEGRGSDMDRTHPEAFSVGAGGWGVV